MYCACRAISPLTAAGLPSLSLFRGEADAEPSKRSEPKSKNTMWNKKQPGGFKPLWVKCGCGKWNRVEVGAVVKYLEKVLSSSVESAGTPLPEKNEKGHE